MDITIILAMHSNPPTPVNHYLLCHPGPIHILITYYDGDIQNQSTSRRHIYNETSKVRQVVFTTLKLQFRYKLGISPV